VAESFTSYEVDNDRRFRNAIQSAADTIGDFRIPFGQILRDFYKSEQSIFKLKGPGQYPAISERYGKIKRKKVGFIYPLLVLSGRLAASLLGPSNPGSVSIITKLSLTFGSSVPYLRYHQSDAPRKYLPQRKVLFIGPEAKRFATSEQQGRLERWLGYIQDHVANVAIKNGIASRYQPKSGA
jgi:hypothetical protein